MAALDKLSGPHCVLLAANYASESNIPALRALTALRAKDLELGLVLRILLTFLPESLDPAQYVEYLHELSTDPETSRLEVSTPDIQLASPQAITEASHNLAGPPSRPLRKPNRRRCLHTLFDSPIPSHRYRNRSA